MKCLFWNNILIVVSALLSIVTSEDVKEHVAVAAVNKPYTNICTFQLTTYHSHNINQRENIVKDGKIENNWKALTNESYTSDTNTDIEYFYLVFEKGVHLNLNPDVIVDLKSNEKEYADPKAHVVEDFTPTDIQFEKKAIEVVYNCKNEAHVVISLSMIIQIYTCQEKFEIHWNKVCIPRNHHPSVNIGFTQKGNEIMQNGIFQQNFNLENTQSQFVLQKEINSITLYMSYAKKGKSLVMKEPLVTADINEIIVLTSSNLSKGGTLTNKVEQLTLTFSCKQFSVTKSDVQIALSFDNFDYINLFFTKQCDTIGELREYSSIIYSIDWMILTLIVIFITAVILYYMKRNKITCKDFYEKIKKSLKKMFTPEPEHTNENHEMKGTSNSKIMENNDVEADVLIKDKDKHANYGGL